MNYSVLVSTHNEQPLHNHKFYRNESIYIAVDMKFEGTIKNVNPRVITLKLTTVLGNVPLKTFNILDASIAEVITPYIGNNNIIARVSIPYATQLQYFADLHMKTMNTDHKIHYEITSQLGIETLEHNLLEEGNFSIFHDRSHLK